MPRLSEKQRQINNRKLKTYFAGLRGTLNLMKQNEFSGYSVKIEDTSLVKLLLCHCIKQKLYLSDYIESVLKKNLVKRSKTYKEYFDQDLDVEIQDVSYLHFFNKPICLLKDERMIGGK
jgi:hypothetical protein